MRRVAICLSAVLTLAVPSAGGSTVLEFASDGTVQITERQRPSRAVQPPTPDPVLPVVGGEYRALAQAVALRYAGSEGVRAVGLDALSFVRLFTAMISVESSFESTAVSSAGALGLGQLMPETAAALGVQDPFDPAENLDGAARYLTAQLARFGSVSLALAAYNAGPERVVEHGGIPPILETQNFVVAVSARAGIAAGPVDSGSLADNGAEAPEVIKVEAGVERGPVVEQGPIVGQAPAVAVIVSDQEPVMIEDARAAVADDAADRSVLLDETRPGAVRAVMSWTDQRGASVWEY